MTIHTKSANFKIVAEGFIALVVFQITGMLFLGYFLHDKFPTMPILTVSILSSSAISPVLSAIYLYIRTRVVPQVQFDKETLLSALSGIILSFLVCLIYVFIFRKNIFVGRLLNSSEYFKAINIFGYVIWAPVIEEVFFRGYLLQLLLFYGRVKAQISTSLLFVLAHLIFLSYKWDWQIFVESLFLLLNSLIFGFAYLHGGLVAAILVHIFGNLYFLFVNS